jgi:hypothetical protein
MDAHHDLVMNARAKAGDGMRLYFAYSTVLDRAAFEEWRDQHGYGFFSLPEGRLAQAPGLGLVYDFPSRWWEAGWLAWPTCRASRCGGGCLRSARRTGRSFSTKRAW